MNAKATLLAFYINLRIKNRVALVSAAGGALVNKFKENARGNLERTPRRPCLPAK